jgi:hypothetical protein
MAYIEQVPKHVSKEHLPGLKVGDLVKTRHPDEWQGKDFTMGFLPAGSLGRVKKIYDFGPRRVGNDSSNARFYCTIKFEGKIPLTTFYTEELVKVRL